jgi:hypothetical protein
VGCQGFWYLVPLVMWLLRYLLLLAGADWVSATVPLRFLGFGASLGLGIVESPSRISWLNPWMQVCRCAACLGLLVRTGLYWFGSVCIGLVRFALVVHV